MYTQDYLRRRIAQANAEHRCSACFAKLPVMSPEDQAKARKEAYAQGMTDEQLADPSYAARICDECWKRSGGLLGILARARETNPGPSRGG